MSVVLERHGLLDPKGILASPIPSEASPAPNANCVPSPSNQSDYLSESHSSATYSPFCEEEITSPNSGNFHTGFGMTNPQHFSTLNSKEYSESPPGKSILDLDPQRMGFAVLDDDHLNLPTVSPDDLQDKVIDSILNDRDINLLAKVYLGTGAELPGRQGPETKVSRPVRPLGILNSDDFLRQLATLQVDKIVNERSRWIKDTGGNLDTLLDDMLISRSIPCEGEDDCNDMDCY